MKNTSMKALLLSAAMTGLLAGAHAATTPTNTNSNSQTSVKASRNAASVLLAHNNAGDADKNSCKGKGGCATDGSKPPSAV